MARATTEAALARRARVGELDLHGVSLHGIARAVGSDPRTIARDLRLLAAERARTLDLAGERLRLLGACRTVEATAWTLFAGLPAADVNGKLGSLGRALAAIRAGAELVGVLAAVELEQRIAVLERRLADEPALSGTVAAGGGYFPAGGTVSGSNGAGRNGSHRP